MKSWLEVVKATISNSGVKDTNAVSELSVSSYTNPVAKWRDFAGSVISGHL